VGHSGTTTKHNATHKTTNTQNTVWISPAYQIQDDILDYTGVASILGKPALADMDLGLSTAPILYAAEEVSAPYIS